MVFDWINNREEALRNGIEERDLFAIEPTMTTKDGVVKNHTFRNFDTLTFDENVKIEDCVFEDCRIITIDTCSVNRCEFVNSGVIFLRDAEVIESTFKDSISDADTLVSLEDSIIRGCTFQNIKLLNDSYLCDGVGNSWIESTCFNNISTGRQDCEIINCEETVGKLFKRTKKFCIIDESSCKGLEQVNCIDSDGSLADSCQPIEASSDTEDVLSKPITDVNFRIPTFNCLMRAGFKTLGELAQLDSDRILEIRNIGERTIAETANMLCTYGITGTAWESFENAPTK
jgi:hypothetical protein